MAEGEMLSEEDAVKLEQEYVSGTGAFAKEPVEAEEEVVEEEEEEKEPSEEGPAIQENKKLRQQKRELNDQMQSLQTQLEALSARVTESQSPKEVQSEIQKASTEDLLKAETQIEVKLYEAIAEGDQETIRQLSGAKGKIKAELLERPAMKAAKAKEEQEAKSQWEKLEETVIAAIPDVKDKSSATYKAAEKWAGENQALMKQYGPAGGVLAIAQALILSKSTSKSDKKAIQSVTKEMEKIAESSVSKSGSTGSPSSHGNKSYSLMPDDEFEKMYQGMLAGNVPIP